jgi:signal transduction histidine kinase
VTAMVNTEQPARATRRWGAATELGLILGGTVALVLAVMIALLVQVPAVAGRYDDVLRTDVARAQQARQLQAAFAAEDRAWTDVLVSRSNAEALRARTAEVDQLVGALVAQVDDAGARDQLSTFGAQHRTLKAAHDNVIADLAADRVAGPVPPDRTVIGLQRTAGDVLAAATTSLENTIAGRADAQRADASSRGVILMIAAILVLLVLLGAAALVVVRILRPIRTLTRDAYRAANETLPATVAEIRAAPTAVAPPAVAPLEVNGVDELAGLAKAFSTMQTKAIELAAEQHRSERESAEMLINLGRRNQSLLSRTLGYITALEATEQDAGILAQLFRLDHATTRIRRNAESMLVLAGAAQTRTSSRPAAVSEVLRGALSEIEDYRRVDLRPMDAAAIAGSAVADLVHLLAELVENAAHFSPPDARVTVTGGKVEGAYRIRVVDHGVGMTGRDLDEANARVRGDLVGRTGGRLLGLDVVGKLAARHGFSVVLEPGAGAGLVGSVVVPDRCLAPLSDLPPPPPPMSAVPVAEVFAPKPPQQQAAPVPSLLKPAAAENGAAKEKEPEPAPKPQQTTKSGVPRRVRGAQLPDLGPTGDDSSYAAPDPRRIRGRLHSLQAGLTAARTSDIPPAPRPHPAPSTGPIAVVAEDE